LEGFDLRKLNGVEDKKEYLVEISNIFVALENIYERLDINSA
jgi:hypothetical protein